MIYTIDLFLLKRIHWLREFCEDWFSWSCRRFERGLIVLYAAPMLMANLGAGHANVFSIMVVCMVVVLVPWMWRQQRQPDSVRTMLLFQTGMAIGRVILALLALIDLALIGMPPITWHSVMSALPMTFYAMFMCSVALPRGGNKPGRKRKLAVAELKKMFGGWLPSPAGSPA
jgi:hypothetical protein